MDPSEALRVSSDDYRLVNPPFVIIRRKSFLIRFSAANYINSSLRFGSLVRDDHNFLRYPVDTSRYFVVSEYIQDEVMTSFIKMRKPSI